MQSQNETCEKFGAIPFPPKEGEKLGVAIETIGRLPINGLRHDPENGTCGWYIWCGEGMSEDPDFFKPLHVSHLAEYLPEVEQYLSLPPGYRFLVAEEYEPFLSEEAQVNPECYGAELAWWLSRELAARGVETSYPNYEDWGWFVEYIVDENEYWLCCGNIEGENNRWRVYLDRKAKKLFGRNKASVEVAAPLLEALLVVLSESPDIQDIQWGSESA